jgi:hypothetical protein
LASGRSNIATAAINAGNSCWTDTETFGAGAAPVCMDILIMLPPDLPCRLRVPRFSMHHPTMAAAMLSLHPMARATIRRAL